MIRHLSHWPKAPRRSMSVFNPKNVCGFGQPISTERLETTACRLLLPLFRLKHDAAEMAKAKLPKIKL